MATAADSPIRLKTKPLPSMPGTLKYPTDASAPTMRYQKPPYMVIASAPAMRRWRMQLPGVAVRSRPRGSVQGGTKVGCELAGEAEAHVVLGMAGLVGDDVAQRRLRGADAAEVD